jgi:hypothetical protein
LEKGSGFHFERIRDSREDGEAGIHLAALNLAQVGPVYSSSLCNYFERQTKSLAKRANTRPDRSLLVFDLFD